VARAVVGDAMEMGCCLRHQSQISPHDPYRSPSKPPHARPVRPSATTSLVNPLWNSCIFVRQFQLIRQTCSLQPKKLSFLSFSQGSGDGRESLAIQWGTRGSKAEVAVSLEAFRLRHGARRFGVMGLPR